VTQLSLAKFSKHVLLAMLLLLFVAACSNGERTTDQASKKPTLPEPDSAGAKLLIEYCSECHAPPHPTKHAKGEWKSVVQRMSDHRTTQGYHTLSDDELITLAEYLDKHALGQQ
jgi:hypothetical protein